MNEIEVKKFVQNFKKYRKLQARLVKLREAKANQKNIKPMTALLAQINGLLKDMDKAAEWLQPERGSKKQKAHGVANGLTIDAIYVDEAKHLVN